MIYENTQLFAFIQGSEWLWIALVILVLFGGSKIPQLMRGLGRGAGEFQKGMEEGKKMVEKAKTEVINNPPDGEDTPSPTGSRDAQ